MSFSIQTNVSSIVAQEHLRENAQFQDQTIQRLTSGYRINQSGDDAAGLSVANQFRNNLSELNQGVRNANDAISQLQIIDGGLNNIGKMLDRLKTLATQAASDTFTGDPATLQTEFDSTVTEIDRQAQNIGLDSAGKWAKSLSVHVGGGNVAANSAVTVDLSAAKVDSAATGLDISGLTLDTTAHSEAALVKLDDAVKSLGVVNGSVGTGENQLQYAVNLAQSQISSYSAAESRIRYTDVAAEASNLTKAQVLQQASMAAMAQANSAPTSVMA
ncbi:MAG: flagellin, partial [Acidobacteria bacterium]|nr:flagellin [Acidobacteriota bacterium]